MPRWQRAYLVASLAVVGGALALILCQYASWPRLTYHPYRRTWSFAPPSGSAIEASYLGLALWSLIGALVGALVAVALAAALRRSLTPTTLRIVGAWALTAGGLSMLFSLWMLWPF